MKLGRTKNFIEKTVKSLSWVAFVALAGMVLLVIANVVGRFLFSKPVPGTVELVELVAVVVVFFAVGYTELRRSHVQVELIVTRLPRRAQEALGSIMTALALVYYAILVWRGGVLAWSYLVPRFRQTYVLSIPFTPFMCILALGSFILVLELLVHVFEPLPPERDKKEEGVE